MRYRLRTLLIVLAIGPPVAAAAYWYWPRKPSFKVETYVEPQVVSENVIDKFGPGHPETVAVTYSNGIVVHETRLPGQPGYGTGTPPPPPIGAGTFTVTPADPPPTKVNE